MRVFSSNEMAILAPVVPRQEPSGSSRRYLLVLCREALKCAWQFVIENRVPAFTCALLGPGLGAWMQWKFGAQSKDDMIRALMGGAWGLLATLALFAVVFFAHFSYLLPKRRLAAAAVKIRELETALDALKQANQNPLILALEQLDAIHAEGSGKAVLYQCPGAQLPTQADAYAWNDRAIAFAKREIFAKHISTHTWSEFKKDWNFADCQRIARVLHEAGYLDDVNDVKAAHLKYLWGRVKRLEELIAKIKGLPAHENKTPIESLTDFVSEVHSLDGVFANLARTLPYAEQNDLLNRIRSFLRKTVPEYVPRLNEIIETPPARVHDFPADFTEDDKKEWSRTRSEHCDRLFAVATYLTRIISDLRATLPS